MTAYFHGGIHPCDSKQLSRGSALSAAPAPAHVILPLLQHIGRPCTPCVAVGDTVTLGQTVAVSSGLSAPIHASVSGTVLAIEDRRHPNGKSVPSIVIANDYRDTPCSDTLPPADPATLSPEHLMEAIGRAGVIGMGGAAFPTETKARSGIGKIDTLIANACECEPYLTADETLLCHRPREVLEGLLVLRRILQPQDTVLAVEDNKPDAIASLERELPSFPQIRLLVLPTRYPQGSEKQLIQAVTHREVPAGKLPADAGCTVVNAATCSAVYRAVYRGQSLTERIVTVTGDAVKHPQNLLVRIGTPIGQLIDHCGGLTPDVWKVIAGGPMMGLAQDDLESPVIKSTGAVLCLSLSHRHEQRHPTCIRCGRCVRACPVYLQPLYLYRFAQADDRAALDRQRLFDCIECGCCSYVCPAKLPLTERFRVAKQAIKEATASCT